VRAQAAPGLFECVKDFVLGHRLVDAPLQDPLGAAAGEGDRFVGGEQRNLGVLQFALDRESLEGAAGDAGDTFADHHVESAARMVGFVQQVGDPAVTGDRDSEPLVVVPATARRQLHPPGLDVVEVRHDHPRLGNHGLGVAELSQQRLPRVLLVLIPSHAPT